MATTFRTIVQKGDPVIMERTVTGAPYPGYLLTLHTDGTFIPHNNAGGPCAPIIALEDELKGGEVGTVYTTANRLRAGIFRPGDEVAIMLANNETAVIGSYLESDGDGAFRVVDADTSAGTIEVGSIRFMALEALSPTAADTLIHALVI